MKATELIEKFKNLKIAVIGDVMLDTYINGKVNRLSPEAPVPIIDVINKENRLGGAGNVALNLKALGATPLLVSVIGNDIEGQIVENLLTELGIETMGILTSEDRITTVKTRIIGNKLQIARIDQEIKSLLTAKDNERLIGTLSNIIANCDAIIFEDYDKGVLCIDNIKAIIEMAKKNKKIIAVDPKFNNFNFYKNVDLFKPNLKELTTGLKKELPDDFSIENIKELNTQLSKNLAPKISMITMSERGVFTNWGEENHIANAHQRNIADVSGAGDSVISVATCALASGCDLKTIAELSNIAGGLVCEQPGVVSIILSDLIKEAVKHKILE